MLKTSISDLQFDSCISNAAGSRCTTEDELTLLLNNPYTGSVVTKSTTLESREGNPQPRYYEQESPFLTINSTGLANHGFQFYVDLSRKFKLDNKSNKPYILSISGMSLSDNLQMITTTMNDYQSSVDLIELNLSCPNVIGKPQIGYDFPGSEELLRKIYERYDGSKGNIPMGLKLPPYFDPNHIGQFSDLFKSFPIRFLTCINSLGNGLVVNPISETTQIKPKNGLGGIGGSVVKPIALSNVFQFNRAMPDHVDIIGCGGITSGVDVFEHILVGASSVQIGSVLMREGLSCFERISQELKDLMKSKDYSQISDFKNGIKFIP